MCLIARVSFLFCFIISTTVIGQNEKIEEQLFLKFIELSVNKIMMTDTVINDLVYCLDSTEGSDIIHFYSANTPFDALRDSIVRYHDVEIKLCNSDHLFFYGTIKYISVQEYKINSSDAYIKYQWNIYDIERDRYQTKPLLCEFEFNNNVWSVR